jgi:hypothetical protein
MKKIFKWEFWPSWLFYLPVYALYAWYSLRARTLMFFSASNPGMYMGGFVDYSKYDILKKIPTSVIPKTFLIDENSNQLELIMQHLKSGDIDYPFILKPDMGERGFAVEKISEEVHLQNYLKKYHIRLVMQEFAAEKLEYGVLYYRIPGEENGSISSVVQKVMPHIIGDGVSKFDSLIKNTERTSYYYKTLSKAYADRLNEVPEKGAEIILSDIGNHCRGATFYNCNHLINERLIETFDKLSKQIDGYYFGRYDIKTDSEEDLYNGKFKIVELNGANSEPAHIYDPEMPLFKAYGFMFRHWKTIFRISVKNHKKGVPYMSMREGISTLRNHFKRRKQEVKNPSL